MILLTVGTSPFQFDRLVRAVDLAIAAGSVDDQVFAQIGFCKYKPINMRYAPMLNKEEFDEHFQNSQAIIGHAGMGTISMALDQLKPLLVMPRLRMYDEHVNDHQLGTARWFEKDGHVLAAYSAEVIPSCLEALPFFEPKPRLASPKRVAAKVAEFLNNLNDG